MKTLTKTIACLFSALCVLVSSFALPISASTSPSVQITQGDWVLNYTEYPNVTEFTRLTFNFTSNGNTYTSMAFNPSNNRLIYYNGSTGTTVRNAQTWVDSKYQNITITTTVTVGGNSGNQSNMALWFVGNITPPPAKGSITINLYAPVFTPHSNTAPGQGSVYNGFTVSYELSDSVTWQLEDDVNYVDMVITAEKTQSPNGTQFLLDVYAEYASHPSADVLEYTYSTRDVRKFLSGYTFRRGSVLTPFEFVDYGMDADTQTQTESCVLTFEFVQEYGKNSTYNVYVGRPDLIVDYNGDATDLDTLIGNAIKDLHESIGDFTLAPNPLVKRVLTLVWINPLSLLLLTPALAFVVVRVVSKRG